MAKMRKSNWMDGDSDAPSTRAMSDKHEKSLVKKMGGRQTANSGARFGENDLQTDKLDIEAKVTHGSGYRINVAEIRKMRMNARPGLVPAQIIRFEKDGEEIILFSLTDFFDLTGLDISR